MYGFFPPSSDNLHENYLRILWSFASSHSFPCILFHLDYKIYLARYIRSSCCSEECTIDDYQESSYCCLSLPSRLPRKTKTVEWDFSENKRGNGTAGVKFTEIASPFS